MKTPFEEVMDIRGAGVPSGDEVSISGADPVHPTRFKIGEVCAAVLGGVGTAVNDIWELKTGRRQQVAVDVRHAAAALSSTTYMQRLDASGAFKNVVSAEHNAMRGLTQPFPTKDGRWALPHFGLPNLRERMLKLLDCEATPESVAAAVAKWDALELEQAIDEARVCGGMVRSNAEWLAHEHGQVLAAKPIVEILKIGDSDPEPFGAGDRPLSGIRALDLTRILAGPIAARTLAENGADVMMVTAEGLPQIPEHVIDTSHGKRSCYLNLKDAGDAEQTRQLVRGVDVFSQGYRPGVMEGFGLGPENLAEINPGIVYLSISCYGADGPLSGRAGWEQIAQCATGICLDNGDERPTLLPAATCDYTTGYLGAYGVLLALGRRAREGGSYHVRVSLCQSGMFIYRQGQVDYSAPDMDLSSDELDAIMVETETGQGPLKHMAPILKLSETPPFWDKPTPLLGSSQPAWAA